MDIWGKVRTLLEYLGKVRTPLKHLGQNVIKDEFPRIM